MKLYFVLSLVLLAGLSNCQSIDWEGPAGYIISWDEFPYTQQISWLNLNEAMGDAVRIWDDGLVWHFDCVPFLWTIDAFYNILVTVPATDTNEVDFEYFFQDTGFTHTHVVGYIPIYNWSIMTCDQSQIDYHDAYNCLGGDRLGEWINKTAEVMHWYQDNEEAEDHFGATWNDWQANSSLCDISVLDDEKTWSGATYYMGCSQTPWEIVQPIDNPAPNVLWTGEEGYFAVGQNAMDVAMYIYGAFLWKWSIDALDYKLPCQAWCLYQRYYAYQYTHVEARQWWGIPPTLNWQMGDYINFYGHSDYWNSMETPVSVPFMLDWLEEARAYLEFQGWCDWASLDSAYATS